MESNLIEQLTGATNPNDFVGRKEAINSYHEILREFARSNKTIKWIHISGESGIGKSSLLRKLRMDTELERVATGSAEVPVSPKFAIQFLSDIKRIIDEMAPEWRNFLQRRRNAEIASADFPSDLEGIEINDSTLDKLLQTFFADLDKIDAAMKKERFKHGIFLDDLDRLIATGYGGILLLFSMIAKRLMDDDYDLLLVTTSHHSANEYFDFEKYSEYVLHLELNQFDFNEAELMIRRRGKLVKSKRDTVVQASTRFPFDLALRQLIESKGIDSSKLDAQTLTEAFNFTKGEITVLRDISKHGINLFVYDDYIRLHSQDTINGLKDGLLFSITQDGYFAVDSTALFELISHVFKPIDPRTEVILILDRIKDQAEIGQLPSLRDLQVVRDHFRTIADKSLIFELSGQVSDTTKAALEGGLIHTAWELLELATLGLQRTGDYEKIGDLQENIAKGFGKANHEYFSAKAYQLAGEYFGKANIEWRSISNYREGGLKYKKEADKTNPEIYHYAIRSMLKQSIICFILANERSKAKEILNEAKRMLLNYPNHIDYFDQMEELINE
ncbi:MAG: ATP-binding protein [Candidatus Heimdallarchaeota archaeon]|nr:ATP-binding protein [Candidatus Heimdallarchaeota archaeon]